MKEEIPEGEPLLYRVPQARRKIGMGNTTFYGLLSSGKIKSVKIGRTRLVPAEALREFVAGLSGSSAQ